MDSKHTENLLQHYIYKGQCSLNKVSSGTVVPGTDNVSALAEGLKSNFWRRKGFCGIAIANATQHRLIVPQRFIKYGQIQTLPMAIKPGTTGMFTTTKILVSPWGSEGVVTYDIETKKGSDILVDTRFQLMWKAPSYVSLNENKVNVALGPLKANEELFDRMSNDLYGKLVRAKHTCHVFKLGHGFSASVYMGEETPTPVAVTLMQENNYL